MPACPQPTSRSVRAWRHTPQNLHERPARLSIVLVAEKRVVDGGRLAVRGGHCRSAVAVRSGVETNSPSRYLGKYNVCVLRSFRREAIVRVWLEDTTAQERLPRAGGPAGFELSQAVQRLTFRNPCTAPRDRASPRAHESARWRASTSVRRHHLVAARAGRTEVTIGDAVTQLP